MAKDWIDSHFGYERRSTWVVHVGNLLMGGIYPIRVQSMANTSTMDTEASVDQAIRIAREGGELVRFTAQGEREAGNLLMIRKTLSNYGCDVPLVADIHFNPKAADEAAKHVEKVRINPGNYVDPIKTFALVDYSEQEYAAEIEKIRERFIPFLHQCSERKVAIRIGVNHGSLSDRIMSRYGDTPEGMVASCMEFLSICIEEQFLNVVISMKSSNTVVMVASVRLLVKEMDARGMRFPLHLGVTEAGDGEDGRIKSAVGIGALLAEGIGDTIRVSLSEDPECEIPVARKLVNYISAREFHAPIVGRCFAHYDVVNPIRRETRSVGSIGGGQLPVVVTSVYSNRSDYYFVGDDVVTNGSESFNCYTKESFLNGEFSIDEQLFVTVSYDQCDVRFIEKLRILTNVVIILRSDHINLVDEMKAFFHLLLVEGLLHPVILLFNFLEGSLEDIQVRAGADAGALYLSGFGDGLMIKCPSIDREKCVDISFGVLQAVRLRITKTEYISCPGCGRTLFDLQKTIAEIKSKTAHLNHLKIGIMGCIVNGPGEMADADYGYVGAGRGKISLYKGKICVERNIDQSLSLPKLIELIKANGDWIDSK